MAYEKNPDEIGKLWAKTSAKGVEYLNGDIEGIGAVVCFKAKPSERGPTWRVLRSQPREPTRAPERSVPATREPVFDDDFERVYDERAVSSPNYEDDIGF